MTNKKKINTDDLIKKIEKITKSRMASQEVVPLEQFRELKKKVEQATILVIEDDDSMRAAMKRIFEAEGYLVKMVSDGTELSSVLDDTAPDLIILDVGLPWLDGFELAQMLKEHRELKKIPLVFVSGLSSEQDVQRAFDLGASDYIKKPFDIDKLKKSVATLLKLQDG